MEFKILIYVVIAIIYLVSRAMKKSRSEQPKDIGHQRPDREVTYHDARPAERPKQLSFEELLKEIADAKKPATVLQPPSPRRDFVDYDDDLEDEEKSLEKTDTRYEEKKRLYAEYEEGKRQAFVRPSLEETMSLQDTKMQFGKFKEFESGAKRNLLEEYLVDFKDQEGFRKAVVMSEILNRKF